jgi:hypothetical protein
MLLRLCSFLVLLLLLLVRLRLRLERPRHAASVHLFE